MRKITKILSGGIVGILMLAGLALPARASNTATISVSPASGTYTVGEEFNIAVMASGGGQDMSVYKATVSVSNLTVVSMTQGSYGMCTTTPSTSSLTFNCGTTGAGASSLTVYTVRVKGTAAGAASISLSGGRVVSTSSTDILLSTAGGSYTIAAAAAAAETTTTTTTTTTTPAPTCTITANPTSVAAVNDQSTLSWTTTNATSVSASWTSSRATTGSGSVTVRYAPSSIFRMTATGAGGTGSCSVSVRAPETATTTTEPATETPATDTAPTMPSAEGGLATQWGTYAVDTALALNISLTATLTADVVDDTVTGATFTGTATPGALVTLYIYSNQITKSATADASGNWTITLTESLTSGVHTIYAIATKAGVTTRTAAKQLISVSANDNTVVKTTAAAEAAKDASTSTSASTDSDETETNGNNTLSYILIGVLAVLLAATGYWIYRRRKNARII